MNATTDGVVRDPSALGMTVGFPASVTAMTELVVPRSMPTALAIADLLSVSWAAPMSSPVGLRPVGYIDPAGLGCLRLRHRDGQDAVGKLRTHLGGLDVTGEDGAVLEPAGPAELR